MKPLLSMREALSDQALLGGMLEGETWSTWRTMLIACMDEELTPEERAVFTQFTGREREPGQRVAEAAFCVGRRGGKSKAMAVLATYVSGLCSHVDVLTPGEVGRLLIVAVDMPAATIVLNYVAEAFERSEVLRPLIVGRRVDELELRGNITVTVRPASFRKLRGMSAIGCICDELAFWYVDQGFANPDTEVVAAVRPALLTTRGPLFLVSSVYAKAGVLWETYKRHHGASGAPLILVAKGTSREFNPGLPQAEIDRALEADPARNRAEYLREWRSDVETFVSAEVVEACVGEYREMLPAQGLSYRAFTDPSGGSGEDSFTLAIGHREKDRVIIDCVREVRPRFSPANAVTELAALVRSYRCVKVVGDHFAGEFPRELFAKAGIAYEVCKAPKSDLYRDLLPLLNAERITLPRYDRLVAQLVGLERRVTRAGKDSITHADRAHDDVANACAGVASLCAVGAYNADLSWVWGMRGRPVLDNPDDEWRRRNMVQHVMGGMLRRL